MNQFKSIGDRRPWCRRGRRSMEDTKKKMKCSGNEDKSKKSSRKWRFFWWRWRVEVELWYGRWLEEMKEKVSHVCSQKNRRVEWSQHKHSIRNFKSSHYNIWVALFIGIWPAKWRENATKMKCKCSLEKKLDCRPCDVVNESWWCQVAYHTLLAQVTCTMLPSHSPCLVHALLASKWRVTQVILGQR